jgi:PAS domain S-box-containing protein
MKLSGKFWEMVEHFMEVIRTETGFPVLIYDEKGTIVRATDRSRIGDLHAGAEKIMQGLIDEYEVPPEEAARNPLVQEGYSCPIVIDGKRVAGFGITGKVDQAKPLAKIATRLIDSWIADRKHQEQLERSERKYRSIFDHSAQGIFQSTLEGRLLTANIALAKMYGYPSPDALLAEITDIGHELYADPGERKRMIAQLYKKGSITGFVTRDRRRDGQIIDVSMNAHFVTDPESGERLIEGIVEDVTEKNKILQAVKLSEEKYSKAFNRSPVWVVLSSMKTGRYIEVNETFLRSMGYTREEVIGRTSLEINTWENPDDRQIILDRIEDEGHVRNHEVRRLTGSGKTMIMLFSAEVIEISGETCLLSVSQDISARKQAEEDLRLSEDNLRITLDSIGDAVITTDTNGKITRMNPMAERFTGWKDTEAVGRSLPEVFHIINAHTRKPESNPVEKVLLTGEIRKLTDHTVLVDKKGNEYQIADSGAPIRGSDGKIVGVVLVFRDVSEAYAQAKKIRENERRYRDLFNEAPVMYVITENRSGEPFIKDVNNMFSEVLGYSRREVINTPLKKYYTEESVIGLMDRGGYQRALDGTFTAEERSFIARNGKAVHTLLHALPEVNDEGQTVGTRAMFVDITARKPAEKQAKELETALAQAQKMEAIGTLAGGIAHDFNNILSAVIGYAELELNNTQKETRQHQNLEHILIAGLRARDLVRQILTFSRQNEHELRPLQIAPLITEALELLRSSLPSTIKISRKIDSGLDNVMADPIQIHQIIMNLCTNAAQSLS